MIRNLENEGTNSVDEKPTKKKFDELELHEACVVFRTDYYKTICMRVPGGYIYYMEDKKYRVSSEFVPTPRVIDLTK